MKQERESGAQRRMRKATRRANQEQKRKARKEKDAEKQKEEGEGGSVKEKRRDANKKPAKDIEMVWEGRSWIEGDPSREEKGSRRRNKEGDGEKENASRNRMGQDVIK